MKDTEVRLAALEALVGSTLAQFLSPEGIEEMRQLNRASGYTQASGTKQPEAVEKQIDKLLDIAAARHSPPAA